MIINLFTKTQEKNVYNTNHLIQQLFSPNIFRQFFKKLNALQLRPLNKFEL